MAVCEIALFIYWIIVFVPAISGKKTNIYIYKGLKVMWKYYFKLKYGQIKRYMRHKNLGLCLLPLRGLPTSPTWLPPFLLLET